MFPKHWLIYFFGYPIMQGTAGDREREGGSVDPHFGDGQSRPWQKYWFPLGDTKPETDLGTGTPFPGMQPAAQNTSLLLLAKWEHEVYDMALPSHFRVSISFTILWNIIWEEEDIYACALRALLPAHPLEIRVGHFHLNRVADTRHTLSVAKAMGFVSNLKNDSDLATHFKQALDNTHPWNLLRQEQVMPS